MTKVFGSGSPEWNEARASNAAPAGTAGARTSRRPTSSASRSTARRATSICARQREREARPAARRARRLHRVPGRCSAAKYVNPAIYAGQPVELHERDGQRPARAEEARRHRSPTSSTSRASRASTACSPSTTLSYVAQMQEAGIPVTFGYISDAHDQHGVAGEIHATRGPGRGRLRPAAAQLRRRVRAVLRPAGRRRDQQEEHAVRVHRRGGRPLRRLASRRRPAATASTSPCNYSLRGRGQRQPGRACSRPSRGSRRRSPSTPTWRRRSTSPATRRGPPRSRAAFGRGVGAAAGDEPVHGQSTRTSPRRSPTRSRMKTLHMVTADPQRTPTLTMFAYPDYFFFASSAARTARRRLHHGADDAADQHVRVEPRRHPAGDRARPGWASSGPGVKNSATTDTTWTDHTDTRPTMLDAARPERRLRARRARWSTQLERSRALPSAVRQHRDTCDALGAAYKQLNAPFGVVRDEHAAGLDASAIKSGTAADDSRYNVDRGPDRVADRRSATRWPPQIRERARRGGLRRRARQRGTRRTAWIAQANAPASSQARGAGGYRPKPRHFGGLELAPLRRARALRGSAPRSGCGAGA